MNIYNYLESKSDPKTRREVIVELKRDEANHLFVILKYNIQNEQTITLFNYSSVNFGDSVTDFAAEVTRKHRDHAFAAGFVFEPIVLDFQTGYLKKDYGQDINSKDYRNEEIDIQSFDILLGFVMKQKFSNSKSMEQQIPLFGDLIVYIAETLRDIDCKFSINIPSELKRISNDFNEIETRVELDNNKKL